MGMATRTGAIDHTVVVTVQTGQHRGAVHPARTALHTITGVQPNTMTIAVLPEALLPLLHPDPGGPPIDPATTANSPRLPPTCGTRSPVPLLKLAAPPTKTPTSRHTPLADDLLQLPETSAAVGMTARLGAKTGISHIARVVVVVVVVRGGGAVWIMVVVVAVSVDRSGGRAAEVRIGASIPRSWEIESASFIVVEWNQDGTDCQRERKRLAAE
jgi:hypothetical protein